MSPEAIPATTAAGRTTPMRTLRGIMNTTTRKPAIAPSQTLLVKLRISAALTAVRGIDHRRPRNSMLGTAAHQTSSCSPLNVIQCPMKPVILARTVGSSARLCVERNLRYANPNCTSATAEARAATASNVPCDMRARHGVRTKLVAINPMEKRTNFRTTPIPISG